MAKDPAILFYTQDFITGTMFFSFEQKGKYISLLCAQHQHGGLINKNDFNSLVGDDIALRSKFIETEDGFFNERLMKEMNKRSKKSTNLSANALIRWDKEKQKQCKSNAKAYARDMPTEDENENEDVIINDIKKDNIPEFSEFFSYAKTLSIYHSSMKFQVEAKYNSWLENKWKDGHNKPIKNWKTKLQNTMPYFKKDNNNGSNRKDSPRGSIDFDKYAAEREASKPRGHSELVPDAVSKRI